MAVLDAQTGAVVISIVYDGAPMAGKTTSIRALGKGLGVQAVSPAEVGGRTLYFDWLDYTGGLFEGRRIRCQIVGVPGQATLAPRRRRLLESADAVVFVGDCSPDGFAADRGYLRGLSGILDQLNGPPVGVVLQANKRDHPEAVSVEDIRSMLGDLRMRVGVVESVATDGAGIREAFVLAVRLALDRVRELMRLGQLATTRPPVDNAQDLLRKLQLGEGNSLDLAADSGLVHTRLSDVGPQSVMTQVLAQVVRDNDAPAPATTLPLRAAGDDTAEPAIPDDRIASGMIWPPVDGRMVLNELASAREKLSRSAEGDWSSVNGRWRILSKRDEVFHVLEQGRIVLVQSARTHAASARGRSVDRCVALAPDGHGRFRLWQIVRVENAADDFTNIETRVQ
jgi:signal recognition particle receptor subunit beta